MRVRIASIVVLCLSVLFACPVCAAPSVTIFVPAGDDEYVSDITSIKTYAHAPDGISSVKFYVDNVFKGNMYQEEDYWRFDWNTIGTEKGWHTIKAVAVDANSESAAFSWDVYVHPEVRITEISFEQDHRLFDRTAGTEGAVITRPQWVDQPGPPPVFVDNPIAYTRNSQMTVRPKFVSSDVSVSVFFKYVVDFCWDDNTLHSAEKSASGVMFPYNQLPYYPTARDTVSRHSAYESYYEIAVRKHSGSNWCYVGGAIAEHNAIYHTLANPLLPWGAYETNNPVWTEVLDDACQWADGQTTSQGVVTSLTTGLHSLFTGEYMYIWGYRGFTPLAGPSQEFFLNCFLSAPQKQGDCKDFANYLCLLANSVGVNLQARRTTPPPTFWTNEYYCAGDDWGSRVDHFNYHQYGLYGTVYDAAIRFTPLGNPPINMEEENGSESDYETALVERYGQPGFWWNTETPQKPTINPAKIPTIESDYAWINEEDLGTTSAVVNWFTNVAATSSIHWDTVSHPTGGTAAYDNHSLVYAPFPLPRQHRMSFDNLSSGTKYYYRVESSGAVSSEKNFTTLPEA